MEDGAHMAVLDVQGMARRYRVGVTYRQASRFSLEDSF
jgi:hypothetical protein